jgi:phospholipase/carboxylesterase
MNQNVNKNDQSPSSDGHKLLSLLHRPPSPGVTQPWLLVLMHGVGSNEEDLFGLADEVPARFHVISLRAPFVLGPGSYAWFEFSVAPDGSRRIDRIQEAASRDAIVRTVQAAARQLGVPLHRVVLGGFSQGGIMALSLLRTRPDLLQAAMVMHSRLLPEVDALAAPGEVLQGKQLWVSHGLQDGVIPLANAQAIRAQAATWPVTLTYNEYPGAHEIRPAELQAAMRWLGELAG